MKKTLIALSIASVLAAASGVAHAQSSVNLYGIAEGAVSHLNDGTTNIGSTAATNGTGVNGLNSRIGFRGVEDLGGGLKAKFELEQRFGTDTGRELTAGVAFAGRSVVGLESATFGEVLLGRNYIPAHYVGIAADPFAYDGSIGQMGVGYTLAGYTATGGASRMNDSLTYIAPKFVDGLSIQLAASASEGTTGNAHRGLNAIYKTGKLTLGYAHDKRSSTNNMDIVMASYDLGFVKPVISFTQSEVAGAKQENMSVGATAPFMGGTLKALYSQLDRATNIDTEKFALGYEYSFSKRTSAFGAIASAKQDGLTRTNGTEIGLRHRF